MSGEPLILNDQIALRKKPADFHRVLALFAGVRVRLMLLVLLVFVPAFALLVYVADRERENGKNDVRQKALTLARLAADEQSQIVQSTYSLLQYLVKTPETQSADTASACNAMVAREIRAHPNYDNLGVVGPAGIRFCSVLSPELRVDLSDRNYFRRTLETREFSIGDYQIGRSSSKPSIGFGYPVLDAQGAVRAVVYATLNLDWVGQSLVRKQLPADAVLSVIDEQGTLLARFPEKDELLGKPIPPAVLREILSHHGDGTIEGIGTTGARLVWGFVPLLEGKSGNLIVRVSLPVTSAYQQVEQTYYRNLLFVAITALGIVLVAWVGGERLIMRPVRALNATAQRLGRGEYAMRTGGNYAAGELGELARVFDNMAQTLQQRDAELQRVMHDLEQQAITDVLTGLYNRRFLYEVLPRELTRAHRNSRAVAVMLMDIDHFKRVNDTYGHEAGDLVLKKVSRLIRDTVRASDICCRYGGEEISVILPEAPIEGARVRAEALRAAIEALEVDCPGERRVKVTISIGVAVFPDHGADADALLRAADEALYAAKGAGRNQVIVHAAPNAAPDTKSS